MIGITKINQNLHLFFFQKTRNSVNSLDNINNLEQEVRLKENFECDLIFKITDLQPLLSNYSEDRRNVGKLFLPSFSFR